MRKLFVLLALLAVASCSKNAAPPEVSQAPQDQKQNLPATQSSQDTSTDQLLLERDLNELSLLEMEVTSKAEPRAEAVTENWGLSKESVPKRKPPLRRFDRHDWKIDAGSGKTYQSDYHMDKVLPGTYIEPGLGQPQGTERGIGAVMGAPVRQKSKTHLAKRLQRGMVYWKAHSPRPQPEFNTEAYDHITENTFRNVLNHPLSTFSVDVDSASYANMRRFINNGQLPPKDSVRIEELVNYFPYHYEFSNENEHPFAVNVETAQAFWEPDHQLVRIGIKGKDIDWSQRPDSNLVFLIDVSGSMRMANKLTLVKKSLKLLAENLGENDRVAMVVYAGASGLALPSTTGDRKSDILEAIEGLEAGGSTNGGAGIRLAYQVAKKHFIKGGVNRVILATDGDFNVGTTNQGELVDLIQTNAKSNVFLTVLGYGMGNYKDSTLEKLADKGNGNYAYIDTLREAKKVLVEQIGGTMMTIAKDVKIQIEFNPLKVASYRLIGYENRMLNKEDFNDDKKDAGEIGAGHTVTALYEIVPAGLTKKGGDVDALKYTHKTSLSEEAFSDELLTVKLRYKEPEGSRSRLIAFPVTMKHQKFARASGDFKFAAAVASFGMMLRESEHKGHTSFGKVLKIVDDPQQRTDPYRREFVDLVRKAFTLSDEPQITQLN